MRVVPRHYEEEFRRRSRAIARERQARAQNQNGVRHLTSHPAPVGAGDSQQRLDRGGRQPHARAERAGRAEETKPPVGDGGGRFRTSGAGIRTKADVIRSNAGRCPISAQCGILGVPKSTYYWMPGHSEAARTDPHEGDMERV